MTDESVNTEFVQTTPEMISWMIEYKQRRSWYDTLVQIWSLQITPERNPNE